VLGITYTPVDDAAQLSKFFNVAVLFLSVLANQYIQNDADFAFCASSYIKDRVTVRLP